MMSSSRASPELTTVLSRLARGLVSVLAVKIKLEIPSNWSSIP